LNPVVAAEQKVMVDASLVESWGFFFFFFVFEDLTAAGWYFEIVFLFLFLFFFCFLIFFLLQSNKSDTRN